MIAAAVEAATRGALVPAPKRGEAIRRSPRSCARTRTRSGASCPLENGKIKAEGDGEVQEMIDIADFAVGQSRMLYGLTMHSERAQHRMYEQWHPLGVVGVISAFNFPVAVWSWNAFLACICGNATVWKPSPKTASVRARRAAALQPRARAARVAGDLSDLHRRRDRARRALRRGSRASRSCPSPARPTSGRRSAVRVAERLGKSLLELGGNNAIIVDESANLDLAVPSIVFGAVGHRRPALHHALVAYSCTARAPQELEQRLLAAYRQVRIGDPLEPGTLMGR